MGIGGITSTNSMSLMQMTTASLKDQKSKSIQNEITDVQQQIQKLSSKEELSVNEKANERKKLQKEISDLNTELKQHQEELRSSQKREIMMARLQEDEKPAKEEEPSSGQIDEKKLPTDGQQAENQESVISRNSDGVVILKGGPNQDENPGVDTENKQAVEADEEDISKKESESADNAVVTDAGISRKDVHAMVSADSSTQQANRLGTVISKTSDGIAILKGEINLDEIRGEDTERKQAALEKMEKKEERAAAFQFSILAEASNAAKPAAEINGTNATARGNAENNAFAAAMNVSQEAQASQPRFYVSIA